MTASVQHTACVGFELGAVWYWKPTRWQSLLIACDGEQAVVDAMSAGRGVLLLVPHFGNWEYLSLHFGTRFPLTALYDPPRIGALESLVRRARERSGTRLLPISRSGIRAVFETLESGGAVALLPDQVPDPAAGVYAPFFGRATLTMTFAHRLIRRSQPLVFLCSAERTVGGFHVRYQAASQDVYSDDPATHAGALNRDIEAIVSIDPAQYQWEYKRFKRPPEGELSPYPKGLT